MVSYYRICVSQNGCYLFATEQGQLMFHSEAMKIYNLFLDRFPVSEGYKVEVIYWRAEGFTPVWAESGYVDN